ncbi:hypothetical protein PQX77_018222 [Marasmius sp. AFHP31]|nr:hypothetical protein PQX77_018222 [Marasmius sp. AFHP31]
MVNLRRSLRLRAQAQKLVLQFFKPAKVLEDTQEIYWSGSMAELAVWRHDEADDEFCNQDPQMLSAGLDSKLDELEEGPDEPSLDGIKNLEDLAPGFQQIALSDPSLSKVRFPLPATDSKATGSKKRKRDSDDDGSGNEMDKSKEEGKGKSGGKGKSRRRRKKKKGTKDNRQAKDLQEESEPDKNDQEAEPQQPEHRYTATSIHLFNINTSQPSTLHATDPEPSTYTHSQLRRRNHRLRRHEKGIRKKHGNTEVFKSTGAFGSMYSRDSVRLTTTGWQGLNAGAAERAHIMNAVQDGNKVPRKLFPIYYEDRNTALADSTGAVAFYRSKITNTIRNLLLDLVVHIWLFIRLTTFNVADLYDNRSRGEHWFCIAGIDRNNKKVPAYTVWHRQNRAVIEKFFAAGQPFQVLTAYGCKILERVFPEIANRYKECNKFMREKYGLEPPFGLFWNFCLNGMSKATKPLRVFCTPHVDYKNIALGVCMIFIYGHFNHRETCWLVAWEAGVAFELPPGVFLIYPSSLFLHFNMDVKNLDFVVTEDGSIPTRDNSRPLCCCGESGDDIHGSDWNTAKGRGSMVWFNQATMFQTSELGEETGYTTVELAKANKVPSQSNTEFWKNQNIHPVWL